MMRMIKILQITVLLLVSTIVFAQTVEPSYEQDHQIVEVYVLSKSKILLNGEKSSLRKLEKFLVEHKPESALIGTLKPTPLKVFATFEKVVYLMDQSGIDANWYRDREFEQPFFDEEGN